MLPKDHYLSSYTVDSATLLDLAQAEPSAPITHCGEWVARDLVAHIGAVWDFMRRHVAHRATERDGSMAPPALGDHELFDWARRVAADLGAALESVEPDEPVWSWTSDKSGGFYLRRAAQETAVHLWDVHTELATTEPLDAELAVDGIDELVDVTFPNLLERGVPEPIGSLHLHRTDGDGEWSIKISDGVVDARRAHEKADAALKGSASDLDLALWERIPLDADGLQLFGDAAVAKSWTALTR